MMINIKMMKNNYYLPTAITLAMMSLSACQSDSIKPESYGNDAPLTFNVSLFGSNKSKETKSSELLSVDRQVNWTPGSTMQEVTLRPASGETQLAVDATTDVIGGTDGTFVPN